MLKLNLSNILLNLDVNLFIIDKKLILNLNNTITKLALSNDDFLDFEYGLRYYSAIENKIDIIITRNKKDFKKSKIPVLTAKEFLMQK